MRLKTTKTTNMTTLRWIACIVGWLFFLFAPNHLLASRASDSFVLVLDAGHGGNSSGAIGRKSKEKDINLAVTLLAGKYISEKYPDVKVIYTRTRDVAIDVRDRVSLANKSQANLFISVHTNGSESSSVKGLEVFAFGVSRAAENLEIVKKENSVIYMEDNYKEKYEGYDPNSAESYIIFEFMQNKFVEQSLEFATMLHKEMKVCAPWKDRGLKQEGKFLVLRGASMPRILIELDFITNFEAENLLRSAAGQKKYAQAICNAFGQYKASYDRKNSVNTSINTSEPPPQTGKDTAVNVKPNPNPNPNKSPNNTVITNPVPSDRPVYKVQILTSSQRLPANSPRLKGYKANYYMDGKEYKYTYGESNNKREMEQLCKSLSKDFKGAFIVTFENGVRIK